jgi:hypothetical protein
MKNDSNMKNLNKCCIFHYDNKYDTNDCYTFKKILKDQLLEVISNRI